MACLNFEIMDVCGEGVYLRGMNLEELVDPRPGRPCRTGLKIGKKSREKNRSLAIAFILCRPDDNTYLYEMENSPR